MLHYLIVCRSLTYAQRAAKLLERAGVTGTIVRIPAAASESGCGYCVKISETRLSAALKALKQADFSPIKILLVRRDGSFDEVHGIAE